MEWIANYKVAIIERVKKYYNPDIIQFHDDYGNTNNMFMPLSKWNTIVRPNLQKVVDAVKGMICDFSFTLMEKFAK